MILQTVSDIYVQETILKYCEVYMKDFITNSEKKDCMTQLKTLNTEITRRHDISSFKTVDIDEIEVVNYNGTMIDIEVEDDHTFYVSDNRDNFVLTHNTSWPDIDTDAGDRDALIDASRELFGDDAVIPVSNFNTLKLKSLIKDIAKFYDIPFNEVNKMTGPLQDEVMKHAKDENQEKSVFVLKHEDCLKYSKDYREFMEKYPEVGKHAETLFMENRSVGRHAGGVIIAPPEDLEKTMPIIGVRGDLQTPWTEGMNFRNLEDNGFLKFDFLGLTLLKDVENCIGRILKKQGNPNPTFAEIRVYFDENLNCRYNQQDDQSVWEHVYHSGRFTGVFQFTNPGSRRFCLDAKPTTITELAALTAIYRPGPLKANVHRKYVKAKKSASEIKYDHPVIESVLGPTYGFTCLVGDTVVTTEEGNITIQEIVEAKREMNLPSYNASTGEIELDRVVQFFDQGEQETIIIETDDGELELTPDHKVMTINGYVKACDLSIDDEILYVG